MMRVIPSVMGVKMCGEGFIDVSCECLCGNPVAKEWDGDDVSWWDVETP